MVVENIMMMKCQLSRHLRSKLNKQRTQQMLTLSAGKMEMFSRAAAKMTNSAAAGESIGAEIWTLEKTALELFGTSVSKFANKSTDSSLITDMAAKRDDRQFWGFGTREDQERLEHMQQEHQTELLIGSAPRISFRTLLHPCEKGTKQHIEKAQHEERQYAQACIEAYKRQLSIGRHFLHKHPVRQRWEDTFGARSDVSQAHDCDRRST